LIKLLIRCAMFIAGVVLLADIVLPTGVELLQVDKHTSSTERRPINGTDARWADTSYTLHFIGGAVSSCSVGYSAYGKLKDGDAVNVKATKLFKNCVRISKDEEVIQSDKYWKIFALIGGCLFIAAAFGWVQRDDDGSFGIS